MISKYLNNPRNYDICKSPDGDCFDFFLTSILRSCSETLTKTSTIMFYSAPSAKVGARFASASTILL